MYLAEVLAENFRIFGSAADGKALQIELKPGLNALVGENDGGKSAIVDAIRICLWTTSQEFNRLTEDDFFCDMNGRAKALTIRCRFDNLDIDDQATFMEWLTALEGQDPILYVHLRATLLEGNQRGRVAVETHSGENGEGASVEGLMRELLKTTYLKPLRDAEAELSPGRNSRLSQILISHPDIATEATNDFDPESEGTGKTLVGIMKRAEHEVGQNQAVQQANASINTNYLEKFKIGPAPLRSEVGVAGDTTLNRILEKLELVISKHDDCAERTRRGLGYNNALFMSAELLLLGSREAYPTLLIEEPEAHLHPQMQANVIELLNEKTEPAEPQEGQPTPRSVQVIMTTHSPYLAAGIPLERLTLVSHGKTFSLAKGKTRLSESDYAFLERFLDSTKANLFFAKGVVIVEGDAENLLIPVIAEKAGFSFRKAGISVVNVGHVGLFRYSNIFRRTDGISLPINVACLRDRDILPNIHPDEGKGKLKRENEYVGNALVERMQKLRSRDGESVRTFVSDSWTFEFDLAKTSWLTAKLMHRSIRCAELAKGDWPTEDAIRTQCDAADLEVDGWQATGKPLEEVALEIYKPLKNGEASKSISAQFTARFLPEFNLTEADFPRYLIQAFKYLFGV